MLTSTSIRRGLLLATMLALLAVPCARAQAEEDQPLAVPAEFVRYIQLPGQGDQIQRPGAIHFDEHHGEIFVADQRNNRIVIFSRQGAYKFEFPLNGLLSTPRDIETDAEGFIYILGSSRDGRVLQRFDFDGLPLEQIPLPAGPADDPANIRSMSFDGQGRLFLLDHNKGRVFTREGDQYRSFLLNLSREEQSDTLRTVFGDLRIFQDEIMVPVSSHGQVVRHSLEGRFLGTIGQFGALPGLLNFPTCIQVTPAGVRLVLDTGRFCVVAYDADGRFLGEFGGKGQRPGWFINPSLLAAVGDDRVVVGQLFLDRIQVCRIPDFILDKVAANSPAHQMSGIQLARQFSGFSPRRSSLSVSSQHEAFARSRNDVRPNHTLSSHLLEVLE